MATPDWPSFDYIVPGERVEIVGHKKYGQDAQVRAKRYRG
jgi:hypothetical protein